MSSPRAEHHNPESDRPQFNSAGFGPDLGAGVRLRVARSWSMETEVRWLDAPWLSRQNLAVTRLLAGVTYARR
jgi:hypothetical protein